MKGLSESLKSSLLTEARKTLLPEIQGDAASKAAYSTMSIEDAKKKYKHGFLSCIPNEEAVSFTVFNDVEDIQDLLGIDDNQPYVTIAYAMKPLEHKMIDGTMIVKLW